jgi:hypothetical protein
MELNARRFEEGYPSNRRVPIKEKHRRNESVEADFFPGVLKRQMMRLKLQAGWRLD